MNLWGAWRGKEIANPAQPSLAEVSGHLQQVAAATTRLQDSLDRIRESAAKAQLLGQALRLADSEDLVAGLHVIAKTLQQLNGDIFNEAEAMAALLPVLAEGSDKALAILPSP